MAQYRRLDSSSLNELAELIKNFQTRIKKMKSYSNDFQTDAECRAKYNEEREAAQRCSKSIIQELKSKPSKPSDKLQQERLGKEFEKLLAQFSEVNMKVVNKEKEFLSACAEDTPDNPSQQQALKNASVFKSIGELDELAIRERDGEVNIIEHDMIEINKMFKDVALMARQQGINLDAAEGNVDVAAFETDKAVKALDKASDHQKAAKSKAMCIAIFILVACAVIVVFCLIKAS